MSLATICRQVAVLVGVAPFDAWAANDDTSAVEIVAWVNEAQQRVAAEHDWQALLRVATRATAATGVDESFAVPTDLSRFVPDSFWLTGVRRQMAGPLLAAEWERYRNIVGPTFPAFTILGDQIVLRTLAADTLEFRYVAAVADLTADASVTALGSRLERVIMLCAIALYRDAKGLQAGSAAQQYAQALAQAKTVDEPIGELSMSRRTPRLGVAGVGVSSTFILDGGSRML